MMMALELEQGRSLIRLLTYLTFHALVIPSQPDCNAIQLNSTQPLRSDAIPFQLTVNLQENVKSG